MFSLHEGFAISFIHSNFSCSKTSIPGKSLLILNAMYGLKLALSDFFIWCGIEFPAELSACLSKICSLFTSKFSGSFCVFFFVLINFNRLGSATNYITLRHSSLIGAGKIKHSGSSLARRYIHICKETFCKIIRVIESKNYSISPTSLQIDVRTHASVSY